MLLYERRSRSVKTAAAGFLRSFRNTELAKEVETFAVLCTRRTHRCRYIGRRNGTREGGKRQKETESACARKMCNWTNDADDDDDDDDVNVDVDDEPDAA